MKEGQTNRHARVLLTDGMILTCSPTRWVARTYTSTSQKNSNVERAKTEMNLKYQNYQRYILDIYLCEDHKAAAGVCGSPPIPVLLSGLRPSDHLAS